MAHLTYPQARLILIWTVGLSYLLMALLHFDWRSFISYIDDRPRLASLLAFAYGTLFFQLLLLPAWFVVWGDSVRACAIIFSYATLCLCSSILGALYPALGTYVSYGVEIGDLTNINAKYGYFFLDQFHAVRDQSEYLFRLDHAKGIVTFPSVHAGAAALCAWAAWGSRILRFPLLGLNIVMAVSAITHANHYLIDVVAGIGITGLSISVATAVFWRPTGDRSAVVAVAQWLRAAFGARHVSVASSAPRASVSD
ncbi:MAG: phosphatase PAP2 family protein [Pseudomonadota bacterium]|jgi:hypothetical protein